MQGGKDAFPLLSTLTKQCPFLLSFPTFCSPLQQDLGVRFQDLTRGSLCPSPGHVSPAWLAAAGKGITAPQHDCWVPLPPRNSSNPLRLPFLHQGLQGSEVQWCHNGVFPYPGNTVTTQALLDPITDVPAAGGVTPAHPLGDFGVAGCWDASISSLLSSNRLHPLRCPSPYVLLGYILLCWGWLKSVIFC